MALRIDARRLLAEGSITVVRLPQANTEFVAPTGHTISWRELEAHFGPATWWGWADLANHSPPFLMPRLRDFLATHGFYQRGGHDGVAAIVIAEGATYTRILLPNDNGAAENQWAVVLAILGADAHVELDTAVADAPPFMSNRLMGWSPYFDSAGRHIADKSG